MDMLETFLDSFHGLFAFMTASILYAKDLTLSVISVNYDIVSSLFNFAGEVTSVVYGVSASVFKMIIQVASVTRDFISDVITVVMSCFVLIGKFFILLYNLTDLIFHGIENTIMSIITGGQWTAEKAKTSVSDLMESWNSLLDSGTNFVDGFFNLFMGGFTQIGDFVCAVSATVLTAFKYTVSTCCFLADYFLVSIANMVERIVNRIYYILTVYIPNLSKETYLGVIICCVLYLIILNCITYLQRRGMTFPLFRNSSTDVDVQESEEEFSDEEFEVEDSNSNDSENTIVSDSDTEDGDIDLGGEDSISDEDSDIDIQLPNPTQGRYNFRPATPVSKSNLSPDDFEKEIEKEREKRKCVVCQDKKKSVLIMPCRHMCLCVECGNQIARSRQAERRICPLCRGKIQTIMDVYV